MDRARAADLVQWVQAAVTTTRTEAARQRLRRVAKLRACEVADGRGEVGVVEDVEELAPEGEVHSLGESKSPLNGKVGLDTEAAQHIAPKISWLPVGGGQNGLRTLGHPHLACN